MYPSASSASDNLPTTLLDYDDSSMIIDERTIKLPLEQCQGGGLCVRIKILSSATTTTTTIITKYGERKELEEDEREFRIVRAIVDTGSPYLVITEEEEEEEEFYDGYSNNIVNNFVQPFLLLIPSKIRQQLLQYYGDSSITPPAFKLHDAQQYPPTEEIYGSQSGFINWKKADSVTFRDPLLSPSTNNGIVLGLMDTALTNESGGSLLGLIKYSNQISTKVQLRPTFIEQERILPFSDDRANNNNNKQDDKIASFILDGPNKLLTLSNKSTLKQKEEGIFPLIDLRPLGDFVQHYACEVNDIIFGDANHKNGVSVFKKLQQSEYNNNNQRKIVAVFDSGLTGCLLTQPFWEKLKDIGIDPKSSEFVTVQIRTEKCSSQKENKRYKGTRRSNDTVSITSGVTKNRLYYLNPISLDWFDDEEEAPYVIVLGQTFLLQGTLFVDIDDNRAK
eukprot:CAMPEP_0178948816 /NCGR_PEP_ID=MMETSP0789-20121207/5686_1 /TAXON_ID=3005 /ORGANISM="Rhizosolenia setigera, Strain CCMP 1694" /LENGTH=448 /DNA_ID=CAMNT_0020629231 /DNA_START=289 /DNA_END=1632 /DNA_ORIENTATION=-